MLSDTLKKLTGFAFRHPPGKRFALFLLVRHRRRPDAVVSEHKRRAIALWVLLIVGIVVCESGTVGRLPLAAAQGKTTINSGRK